MTAIQIDYAEKLHPIFTKPKRLKIVVGGRASTKSTGVADLVLARIASGELWCCAREHQNSIEESVHRTLLDEVDRLQLPGFTADKNHIYHASGGRNFYRGLSRNPESLKSTLSGIDGLWIEEGEATSQNTIRTLTASVRLNAKDTARRLAGEDIKLPEIIITMNRGSKADPIAKEYLAMAEKDLARCGYYEDDMVMIVQINYNDIPRAWFEASGLEVERQRDEEKMSSAQYRHKWLGEYLDEVENSIIRPEWFDACLDAHKRTNLAAAFEPRGAVIAAHDPSHTGEDAKGYALRHGSIIRKVLEKTDGEIDEGMDWAALQAVKDGADWFVWDGDGMGIGLKRQAEQNFKGVKVTQHVFRGSLSGSGQDNAKKIYQPVEDEPTGKAKTYDQTFKNNRSQYYTLLADRMYNTYRCITRGEYVDPELMVSFDSEGVSDVDALRSELCRIPAKDNPNGLIQIMSKEDMKKLGISSPNLADSVMMTMITPTIRQKQVQVVPIPKANRW